MERTKNILVASYDAGGAEHLSSLLFYQKLKVNYCLSGPALNIYKKKISVFKNFSKKNLLNLNFEILITSAGWSTTFEKDIIKVALKKKAKIIIIMDHWQEYEQRLTIKNKLFIPDEFWVYDLNAKKILEKIYKKNKHLNITLKKNYFINFHIDQFNKLKKKNIQIKYDFLYLSEPIEKHAKALKRKFGYNEYEALEYFLKKIQKIKKNFSVLFRPHPSENYKKYLKIFNNYDLNIKITKNKQLTKDILESQNIIGCETMAMYVATFIKKNVYTAIPPGGKKCALISKKILPLKRYKLL